MDTVQVAHILAPLLPYLLKGGVELTKSATGELGKKIGVDAWAGLKAVADKIRQKAESKPALREALTTLRYQLKKVLEAEPDLHAEATHQLANVQTSGNIAIANGNRSVAIGGDANSSTTITGDSNQVEDQ